MKIRIAGEAVPAVEQDAGLREFGDLLGVKVVAETRVSPAAATGRAAGRHVETELRRTADGAPGTDVLELAWEDGVIELVRADDVDARIAAAGRRDGVPFLPTERRLDGGARGLGRILLQAVKHLRLDPTEKLTRLLAAKAISAIEARRTPKPGVHRVGPDGRVLPEVEAVPPGQPPILVLIHGSFTDTEGSFKGLFATPEWERLRKAHADRVFALERHSLTESPARCALRLVEGLPRGAQLHLLTHSSGGIIGELLCRYPWEGDQRAIERFFADEQYEQVRKELDQLAQALREKEVRVRRFARVACPAAGTLLASKRLDTYLNVILTLIGRVSGLAGPAFSFAKAVALAIVGSRADAEALPGLEALTPHLDRGFAPFLNAVEPRSGAELAVIAGDVEGGGPLARIQAFFSDLFFREDNDLVVDSKSMFRGVPRLEARGFYHRSPEANHFSYFSSGATRACATDWLVEGESDRLRPLRASELYGGLRAAAGVRSIPRKRPGGPQEDERPVVFLLPGIMGSHLKSGSRRIWADPVELVFGGMRKLRLERPDVDTDGLVESHYEKLYQHLSVQHRVEPFPYDWRDSVDKAAHRLAKVLRQELAAHARPVRIIAHSMGGLVSRAMITLHPDLWRAMTERGGRLVMLGTPNHGSYDPVLVMTQRHRLMKALALIDKEHDLDQLTGIVRAYAGLLELLPSKPPGQDLLSLPAWDVLGAFRPAEEALARARELRRRLAETPIDPRHLVYVAGRARKTAASVEIEGDRIAFLYTRRGDGTVPWDLGLLEGVDTYYVEAKHGQLPNHQGAFEGYEELLTEGTTKKLTQEPPVKGRAAAEELFRADDDEVEAEDEVEVEVEPRVYPQGQDLIALVLGAPEEPAARPVEPLRVSVVNADVREATHRVLVGHYIGDKVVSVEKALDHGAGGALSLRHRLDAYPGALGTCHIASTAVIIGLGQVGELTRSSLRETVSRALVELALSELAARRDGGPVTLSVSPVLIGTYGGARINIEGSMEAILDATLAANRSLAEQISARTVRFEGVEFVELYRDVAIEAAHAAVRIARKSGGQVEAEPHLQHGQGALRSRPLSPYAAGWARRISIRRRKDDSLRYEIFTDLARSEPLTRRVRWPRVDSTMRAAIHGDARQREILFRYIVPYQMLSEVDRGTDMVLQLDPHTAELPWELAGAAGAEPLSVRVGMIRQLSSAVRREKVVRSPRRRALVIGEPADVELPPLPGARDEARAVTSFLRSREIEVVPRINAQADEIFSALWGGDYDIIHIAAHGELDEADPSKFGVVLGKGERLTSSELDLPTVPSIVFLNCCHLGALSAAGAPRAPGRLAASVAQHLIDMGVRVVVAAGWAVNDRAAVEFATRFYSELLDGRALIDAVREARRRTYEACGDDDVTWGAYQVYGNDGYTFPDVPTRAESRRAESFVSPHEAVQFISDFTSRAGTAQGSRERITELRMELDALREELPATWLKRGDVTHALGLAYAELGAHDAALLLLRRAVADTKTPLEAAEQLANIEARVALSQAGKDRDRAAELFTRSVERLQGLVQIAPSGERWSLLGATFKRWARTFPAGSAERRSHLQQALDAYTKACNVDPEPPNWFYPASNRAAILLSIDHGKIEAKFLDQVIVSANAFRPADTWSRAAVADVALIRWAAGHEGGPESAKVVADSYAAAFVKGSGATPRERQSMIEHVSTVSELVHDPEVRTRLDQVRDALQRLS
jgi:tetratricopeptide (TPR) repeat protein